MATGIGAAAMRSMSDLDLVVADHRAAGVDLQDQGLGAVGLGAVDGRVDRVDDDRIDESADLQHVDGAADRRRRAGRRRPDRRRGA